MKKFLSVLIFASLLLTSLNARDANKYYIGLSGGYTHDIVKTDTGYRTDISYKGSSGFNVNIPLTYQFSDNVGISSGLSYIQKNYRIEHYYPSYTEDTKLEYQNVINHYIEFPLTLDFTVTNNNYSFTFSAGSYIGYWVLSQRNGVANGSSVNWDFTEGLMNYYSGNYSFSKADNRIETGLLLSFGFEIELNRAIIFLKGSYSLGLTDMRRKQALNYSPLLNDTIIAEIGMLWGFGGEK